MKCIAISTSETFFLITYHTYYSQNETTIFKLYLFSVYLKGKQAGVTLTPLFHITFIPRTPVHYYFSLPKIACLQPV